MAARCFQFAANVSSYSALKWSSDNKIAICVDDSLKILTLNLAVDHCSEQPHFKQSFIPVEDEVYDMPKFTQDEYQQLIKILTREDYKDLVTDTLMNPKSPVSVARKGYCAASWSPKGGDDLDRCVLAALSHDFRLCLFSQKSSAFDWYKLCDLSEMYWNTNRYYVDRIVTYKKFKDHCHEQAVVAICWSPALFSETIKKEGELISQAYSILATASETGHIVLWKIKLPLYGESDCSVLQKVKPSSSYPLCMAWSQSTGILAIGYSDGTIHAVKIDMKDPAKEVTCISVYNEPDLMRTSCLNVKTHPEVEGEIILANKEQYILASTLSIESEVKVVSETCVEGVNSMHGTGFAGQLETILMSSADGIIQQININLQDTNLHLETEKLELDIDSLIVHNYTDVTWLFHGIGVSPNNIFVAITARPSSVFDHVTMTFPTKVLIVPLSTLHKKCNIPENISQTSQVQQTAANIEMYMDQRVTRLLNDEKVLLSDIGDALEMSRCELSSEKVDWQNCDKVESLARKSIKALKIKRYHLLGRYHSKYKVNCSSPLVAQYEIEQEVQKREERKRFGAEILEVVGKLTDLILAGHIIMFAHYLSSNKERLERSNQVNMSIKVMLKFLKCRPYLMEMRPNLTESMSCLGELLEGTEVHEDKCPLCASNLTMWELTSSCTKGHHFGICSKTLLLCDSMDYRTCNVCYAVALSKSRLKDFSWIPGDKNRCTLCDGLLL